MLDQSKRRSLPNLRDLIKLADLTNLADHHADRG
jgi:hypothetical protein